MDLKDKLGKSIKPELKNEDTPIPGMKPRTEGSSNLIDKLNALRSRNAGTNDSAVSTSTQERTVPAPKPEPPSPPPHQTQMTDSQKVQMQHSVPTQERRKPEGDVRQVPKTAMPNSINYTLNELLNMLKAESGSDLHLTTNAPPVIRKHGKLVRTQLPPLNKIQIEYLLKNILNSDQQKRLEDNLTLDFSYALHGCARFRVNIFYQKDGIAGVFRIIPTTIPDIKSLDLPPILSELSRLHRGLILCTGPTGSGKSTTLASMINLINRERSDHIITIEDPIEFVHSHHNCIINQREIGQSAKTFSDALRSALREDPDIILIGEMRDIETISMAVTAAETGHLVFATLHTSSAPKTIDRIIDAFPTHQQAQIRVMIAESLQAVISQTLIPTVDGQGRVCACEILINTPAVSNLIREAKIFQIYSVMQTSKQDGMQTLDQALLSFVKYRKISYAEALKRAQDKKTFASSSGRHSGSGE